MTAQAHFAGINTAKLEVIAAPDQKDIRREQGYDYLRRPAEDPDAEVGKR